jgi:hypothetical protein
MVSKELCNAEREMANRTDRLGRSYKSQRANAAGKLFFAELSQDGRRILSQAPENHFQGLLIIELLSRHFK